MTSSSHGYDMSAGYTYGFCPEMAPDWLDLAARLAGHAPARRASGAPFRYLELGCGQGMGLCLLAAANPHGEFLGVDFLPEHVDHGRGLPAAAGLTQIRLRDGDFVALAADWPTEFGQFDYVTLHGVYSWITPMVREALVRCLGQATKPTGLVYIGYNAQPGWLGTVPFRHISRLIKDVSGQPSDVVLQDSIALFDRLATGGATSFQILPGLKARLAAVKRQSSNYLIHEYLHEGWHPLWHSEVLKEVGTAGLSFVGSASLAETLLPGALPPALRATIEDQAAETLRMDVQDLVINQSFRRDIFRPLLHTMPPPDPKALDAVRLHLMTPVAGDALSITTSFSEITLQRPAYEEIVADLAAGPRAIADLVALPSMRKQGRTNAMQILALLLHARTLAVGPAQAAPLQAAERLNRVIARAVSDGLPYDHLSAATLGSAVAASELDLLLLDQWLGGGDDRDAAALATATEARLVQLGRPLNEPAARAQLTDRAAAFLRQILPRWRSLGVLS